MKYSIITEGADNRLRLSLREDTTFRERIKQDVRNGIIEEFRLEMSWKTNPRAAKRYNQIPRVCPTAVLGQQPNGALYMRNFNGLLLLELKPVVDNDVQEEVKRRAMALPTTAAAFVGASGRSVKILVSVSRPDGTLPQSETEAERFYAEAHRELLPIYTALLAPHPIVPDCKGLRYAFMMPWDEKPRFRDSAPAYLVGERRQVMSQEYNWTTFDTFENDFMHTVNEVTEELNYPGNLKWDEGFVMCLACKLRDKGMPRTEAFSHAARHLYFYTDNMSRDQLHSIIDAAYDGKEYSTAENQGESNVMRQVIRLLEQRYQFRHNVIMGFTEYRQNSSYYSPWSPVTERVVNDLTMELQLAGVKVWNRDVKRYVESHHVRDYDIAEDYLLDVSGKWDGQDHIRQLARTIPTKSAQWSEWFHRFFLGMVAQWQHRSTRFGNAIVPLLISNQGYHKSDFCRQLLPPELRSWGYTESLSMAEERTVLLSMTQMLLICLDEFNQIPAKKQEGFLKNIITLPTVKVKRPYARHVEDLPRLASFIATTNQADVLADPSGSRRFVGIYIDGDIDTSQTPNYEQLYAQAVCELDRNERYWFDEKETEAIMQHNRQFQLRSEAMVFFYEYFETPRNENEGEWMTAANILSRIKSRARGVLKDVPSVNKFAREIRAISSIQQRHTSRNNYYLVRELA